MGEESAKGCEKHCRPAKVCEKHCRAKRRRMILACLCGFVLVVLLTIFIIWLVLRPTKPRFTLQDAAVFQLNLTSAYEPYLLTTTLQPTLASRNPNSRIGVYYDRVHVYASYKHQRITLASDVPPFYQGHDDISVWSPVLYGLAVPISQKVCASIAEDQQAGFMLLHVKVSAKVRWKVGTWISGKYHLEVSCPAFLLLSRPPPPAEVHFQRRTYCSVHV